LPPGDATEWLVVLVALAGVLGAIAIRPQALWTGVALLLLAASPLLMLSRLWNGWDGAEAFAQLGLSSAVLVATGAGLAPLGARARGAALPLALSMVSATGGYVLFAGQSASLGQLSGALAAGFGAAAAGRSCSRSGSAGSCCSATISRGKRRRRCRGCCCSRQRSAPGSSGAVRCAIARTWCARASSRGAPRCRSRSWRGSCTGSSSRGTRAS
jgi:hypothetical protein